MEKNEEIAEAVKKAVWDVLRKFYLSNNLEEIERRGLGYRDLYEKNLQSEIEKHGLDRIISYLSWLIMQKGELKYRRSDKFKQILRERDGAYDRLSRHEVDHGTNW